jgi:hypothetical protein
VQDLLDFGLEGVGLLGHGAISVLFDKGSASWAAVRAAVPAGALRQGNLGLRTRFQGRAGLA